MLYEIIEVIEGLEAYSSCALGFPHCGDTNPCALHSIWAPIREAFLKMLHEKSLGELISPLTTTNRSLSIDA